MAKVPLIRPDPWDDLPVGPPLTEKEIDRLVKGMTDYVNGRTIPAEVVRERMLARRLRRARGERWRRLSQT
jgi:hypothetical protein